MYNFQTSRVGVKKYFINPRRAAIPPKGRIRWILGAGHSVAQGNVGGDIGGGKGYLPWYRWRKGIPVWGWGDHDQGHRGMGAEDVRTPKQPSPLGSLPRTAFTFKQCY